MGGSQSAEREWGELLMADYLTTDSELTLIADAIRAKGGTQGGLVYPAGFVSAVEDLPQMTDPMSFLGKDVELVDGDLYYAAYKLKDTAFNGWAPSSTAQVCVASVTQSSKFTARDLPDYEYFICWECGADIVYDGTETQKALTLMSRAFLIQEICRRPSSLANIADNNFNGNVCSGVLAWTWMKYYGTTQGSLTYTWSASYGFYFANVASTFSSATSDNPSITLKTPTMSARCSTTYLSTANAGKIDQDASKCWIKGKLYRVKRNGFVRGMQEQVVRLINDTPPYSNSGFSGGSND